MFFLFVLGGRELRWLYSCSQSCLYQMCSVRKLLQQRGEDLQIVVHDLIHKVDEHATVQVSSMQPHRTHHIYIASAFIEF